MITEVPTKLRLVRCPKCRKVLPELPNVPVYQCGGCGTILQAKKRKNNVDDKDLLNHGTDRSQKTDLERSSSEDKEPHRSVQEEEPSSAGELLLNQNNGSDESEIIEEKNTNQPEETKEEGTQYGGARLSDGAASSIELDHQHESLESSPEAETHSAMNQTTTISSPRDNQISNKAVSSTEVDHQVSEGTLRQMDGSSYYPGRRDEEDIDDYQKQPEDANFSGEVALSTELNHQLSERSSIDAKSFDGEDENQDYVDESKEDYENLKFSGENSLEEKVDGVTNALEHCSAKVASSPEISHRRSELSSVESKSDGIKNHLGRNNGIDSGGWKRRDSSGELSSSTEDLLSGSPGNSMAHRFSGESFLTDGFMSPRDEYMALDSYEGVGDKPKSRTTTINYAYEGSVSSYDEEDEPISLRKVHLSRKKLKEAEVEAEAEAEAGSTRTVGIDNKVRSGFPDRTVSSEYNRFAAGNPFPVRTRMKFQPDEGTSKPPSCSKSHRAGYENRNRWNYASDEFNHSSSKSPEVLEEEKIELLKMVYDLQKELKRTQISSGKGRFPGDHELSEVGLFRRDLNHTRSAFSCNQGRRPYQNRDPRVPFSAEAALRRRQDDSYCVHCCPQDWQLQALLPPHSCCNRTTQSVFNSGRRSYNLHHSGGSTPRNYPISELSDEHWVRDHDTRRIHREKTQSAKSHVRPVVGGAPLVACYKCSELLQIPADFLLFKRKVHQLKCGGCSTTLKFSLHKGTNIVPYEVSAADAAADIVAPPPSEVDSFSKFASPSRATERDPYSGDYGPPVSYSTETEPSFVGAHSNGRKSRLEASEGRKDESLLKGLGKKIYNSAGGSSSKISKTNRMSSEIKEVSASPLHKLMGYSSPSKVIER